MASIGRIDPSTLTAVPNGPPPAPPPPKTPAQAAVGPTNKWARLAQIGVGKFNYANLIEHKNTNANNSPLKTAVKYTVRADKTTARFAKNVGEGIVSSATGLAKDTNKELIQPATKQAGQFGHLLAHPSQLASEVIHGGNPQQVQATNTFNQATRSNKLSPATVKFVNTLGNPQDTKVQVGQLLSKGRSEKQIQAYLTNKLASQNKVFSRMLAESGGTALLFAGGEEAGAVAKGSEALLKGTGKNAVIGALANIASLLQSNPNASQKEIFKAGASGGLFGSATTLAGGLGGKIAGGVKSALTRGGKARADVTNVTANRLSQAGSKANTEEAIKAGKVIPKVSSNKTLSTGDLTKPKELPAGKAQPKGLPAPKATTVTAGKSPGVFGEGSKVAQAAAGTKQARLDMISQIDKKLSDVEQGKTIMGKQARKDLFNTRGKLSTGTADHLVGKSVGETVQNVKNAGTKDFVVREATAPKTQVEKLTGKAQATEATTPKEGASLTQKVTKPSTPREPVALVNNNQPKAKGLSGLVSTAAEKLHISGKLNPEQALLNQGHTQAAQVIRDLSAARDLGNYRGERAKAIFDKNATKDEQNYETFAAQREANTGTSAAHQHFVSTLQDTGKRGAQAGTIQGARGETYAPRYAKFKDTMKSGSIGGLQKSGGFSKGRVQAGEFGLGGDKYATYKDFKQAVESGGGKTSNATTGEILGHTVASREKAIANAEGLAKLENTPMGDGKPAIVTVAPGETAPAGYDTNLLPGRAVHQDLVPAIKTFVEGPGKANPLTRVNQLTKRLVTVNGAIHDLNYARSSIGEQGLARTIKGFHPTDIVQKGLDNPAYHADTERMIKNGMVTSRTGLTNIFDETNSALNKKITGALGKTRGAIDNVTFGIGDNLGRATYLKVEKGLLGKGLSAKEAGQTAAEAANRVMFTQREGQQSTEAKSIGRVALFAKNFFQSTLQRGTAATGLSKNTALSKAGQRAGQVQAAKALGKSFTYLFAAAQAINYHATGHSTFQNKDSKISPVFYVDKTTGKAYHITNWYGQIGELLHLSDPKAITNKLSPAVQQIVRLRSNQDQPGYSGSTQVYNPNASGLRQYGQMVANSLEHFVTPGGIDTSKAQQIFGSGGQPGKVSAANLFGMGTSSVDNNTFEKDVLNQYYATLPSGASKTPPATTALEAAARHDLATGKTNSANLLKLKAQMPSKSYQAFVKSGGQSNVQRAFDKLPEAQRLQLVEKYSPQQLKELDLTSISKSLVSSSAKATIQGLQAKGFSTQRIQQDLQKIGVDSNQLKQLKAQAKKAAAASSAKARKAPKFINPFTR